MHSLGKYKLHAYSNKCLHFTLNDSNESLNHDDLSYFSRLTIND